MKDTILYLVLPCYNEEDVLPYTIEQLKNKYNLLISDGKVSSKSKILFVNDGSKDRTWELIADACKKDSMFCGANLSRNRGHQNAVLAGLMISKEKADIVISIDADLQQDINAIDEMIEKYEVGFDIVYGVRNTRNTDGIMKKFTALGFYSLMKLMGCEIIPNHADYRMLSRRVLESLAEYNEVNMFLRGLIPTIGFPSTEVYFDVKEREYGESKYTWNKMINFAIDGITSFSVKPIRFITLAGFIMLIVSMIVIILTLIDYYTGGTAAGWSSSYCSIWFIGGVQLLSIGIIGEYIGKIYMETKQRPRYHIESLIWKEDE